MKDGGKSGDVLKQIKLYHFQIGATQCGASVYSIAPKVAIFSPRCRA